MQDLMRYSSNPGLATRGRPQEAERPGEMLRKKGERATAELAKLVDRFGDLFRELPPDQIRERPSKHHIPALPGELPSYPKQGHNLSGEHLREVKEQLRELLGKVFIVPPRLRQPDQYFLWA